MPSPRYKTYSIVALALTTCAAAALAWSLYLQVIKLRAAALDDPVKADLQKRLWDLEKRNKDLEAQLAARRTNRPDGTADNAANPDAAGAVNNGGPGGRFNRRGGGLANLETLLDNPEFNKLWTQQQKERVKLAYADLFKQLKLSPDQADKLNGLLVERQQSIMDVLAAARDQGGVSRDQIGALIQQANASVDSQIQSLLGPDGYAQYTNYLQTQPQRNQVNELQTRLAAAGVPQLQDFQTQQLTQILAQNSAGSGNGGGGPRGGGFGGMGGIMGGMFGNNVTGPTITTNAVTQAGTVLTGDQLQALQQMQQEQAAQQQLQSLLRQTFMNGGQGRQGGATSAGSSGGAPTTPRTTPPRGG